MSFFLLQPITAPNAPISVAASAGGAAANALVAAPLAATGIAQGAFDAALAVAFAQNKIAEQEGELKNLSAQEQAVAASYFSQIIQQLKLDNPAINVGSALDGIKDIQAENDFMAGIVALVQKANIAQTQQEGAKIAVAPSINVFSAELTLAVEERAVEEGGGQSVAPSAAPASAQSNVASEQPQFEQSIAQPTNEELSAWQFLQPTDFMNSAVAAVAYKQAPAIMANEKIVEQAVVQNIASINVESMSAEPSADSQIINANPESNIALSNSNVASENGGFAQNNSSQNSDGNGGAFSRSVAEMIEGKIDTGGAGFSAGNDVTVTAPEKEISLLRFEENKSATSLNTSPFEQISVQIKKLQLDKTGEINLQLNPYELGKVEIKIVTDENNKMFVQITADNRETYDLLRADRSSLERILQNQGLVNDGLLKDDFLKDGGGLKFDESSLQFAHRETNSEGRNQNSADNDNNKSASASNVVRENEVDVSLTNEQIINLNVTTGINIKI